MNGLQKGLMGAVLFAGMVAAPLLMNTALTGRVASHFASPEFGRLGTVAGYWVLAGLLVFTAVILTIFRIDRLDRIASWLRLAERDLNSLLSSALEHGGRKGKALERAEWARAVPPPPIQIFRSGYKPVVHDLFDLNEKDLAGKGAAAGKASLTAFLLRELYEGNVDTAQNKIWAETKNNDNKLPYIAPGIRELTGFHAFDPATGFPTRSGVSWFDLWLTVKLWGFPRDILMVKTNQSGERTEVSNKDVLAELTKQKR